MGTVFVGNEGYTSLAQRMVNICGVWMHLFGDRQGEMSSIHIQPSGYRVWTMEITRFVYHGYACGCIVPPFRASVPAPGGFRKKFVFGSSFPEGDSSGS